ncbi:MAG: hypothetical protein HQK53_06450 [Oligoflexia bacterium]|nr:hypothetical protein [Oligoflexia bacterium]
MKNRLKVLVSCFALIFSANLFASAASVAPSLNTNEQEKVANVASSSGFSQESVLQFYLEIRKNHGKSAMLTNSELSGRNGGTVSWMKGGMSAMITDMFNHQLIGKVTSLANELSELAERNPVAAAAAAAAAATAATMSGSCNEFSWEYYPENEKIVVRKGSRFMEINTLGHHVTQTQTHRFSGFTILTFSDGNGEEFTYNLNQLFQ